MSDWPQIKDDLEREAKALRQRVKELEKTQRLFVKAQEVWLHRVEEAEGEVRRLRDMIVPGDAAAYEEGMAALTKRAEDAEAKLKMTQDQMAEIAASNADHIRWHREMEAKLEAAEKRVEHLELEGKLREVDRMGETQRANEAEAKLAKVILILEDYVQDGGNPVLLEHALAAANGETP